MSVEAGAGASDRPRNCQVRATLSASTGSTGHWHRRRQAEVAAAPEGGAKCAHHSKLREELASNLASATGSLYAAAAAVAIVGQGTGKRAPQYSRRHHLCMRAVAP